ncbi:hypothetical protein EOS_20605 [Caballeronia mineralivorans PML1(12)]|uniref:Transposase n=1 Tax=Caballeronia mineralivorans PML1(12) TaxID=908627 RepID=A0A0J1CUQ6_9BURK|nr:hypothetical protein EOS_20605 [Caballeronia mineralivorans PML1(12)]
MLCQHQGQDLFSEALVVIDGSKFKAVNHRDRNFTSAKLERRMQDTEVGINRWQKYEFYSSHGCVDTPRGRQPASVRDGGRGAHGRVQCSG